jgi:chromosome condensin MukBEF complex kleisin-like MukF subunit
MYECVMVENIHESLYDFCEGIYENMCYCQCNVNTKHLLVVEDLIHFIDDRVNRISKYDINNMLLWYGYDNAVKKYDEYYLISNIDIQNFSKSLLSFLVLLSFNVVPQQ